MEPRPVIAVMGPTASGKSELGLAIAEHLGGEIINCDSVQVYREIEIATAKLPLAERRGIPHHLIDLIPPERSYTAADWAADAVTKIEEIEARGRTAILVGGSGFYLRALRQPFFLSAPTNHDLRARLRAIRERHGPEHLHRMLRRFDPAAADRLAPRDWSRTQRALEVFFEKGEPISGLQPNRVEPHESAARLRIFALDPPREELYERINRRAEQHFTAGLVDEVRDLLERGVPENSSALGAHGYRRVVEHLRGERTLESAIEQTKLDVRHYAKRQLTWLRREPDVEWLTGFGDDQMVQTTAIRRLVPERMIDERL
jgi:tRNA dimethylallyltransferase